MFHFRSSKVSGKKFVFEPLVADGKRSATNICSVEAERSDAEFFRVLWTTDPFIFKVIVFIFCTRVELVLALMVIKNVPIVTITLSWLGNQWSDRPIPNLWAVALTDHSAYKEFKNKRVRLFEWYGQGYKLIKPKSKIRNMKK